MWTRRRPWAIAATVAFAVTVVGCGSSTDQAANHALAAQLRFDDAITWLGETEYTFCSHESCTHGNDRHGVSVHYQVSPDANLSALADRFEALLKDWTRTDYCDLQTGRPALDRCRPPQRSYVIFTRPTGSVTFPKSSVFLERSTQDRPDLLDVNIDTDFSQ